jgi:hypothetical protein
LSLGKAKFYALFGIGCVAISTGVLALGGTFYHIPLPEHEKIAAYFATIEFWKK